MLRRREERWVQHLLPTSSRSIPLRRTPGRFSHTSVFRTSEFWAGWTKSTVCLRFWHVRAQAPVSLASIPTTGPGEKQTEREQVPTRMLVKAVDRVRDGLRRAETPDARGASWRTTSGLARGLQWARSTDRRGRSRLPSRARAPFDSDVIALSAATGLGDTMIWPPARRNEERAGLRKTDPSSFTRSMSRAAASSPCV
jgi:hypothetical protein